MEAMYKAKFTVRLGFKSQSTSARIRTIIYMLQLIKNKICS